MPLDKSMSFGEIVKKEMAAGKPQKQAIAVAYSIKGESKENKEEAEKIMRTGKNNLSWRDRMNTLQERAKRGTERYASKQNATKECPLCGANVKELFHGVRKSCYDMEESEENSKKNEEENLEGHGQLGRPVQNEDEASQKEHEIQESELEKKKEKNPKENSMTEKIAK